MAQVDDLVQVDNIGTVFRFKFRKSNGQTRNISDATTKQVYLLKPDGTCLTKTAIFTTDGTDGYIEYASIANDLDADGAWKAQGRAADGSTYDLKTKVYEFKVSGNIVCS